MNKQSTKGAVKSLRKSSVPGNGNGTVKVLRPRKFSTFIADVEVTSDSVVAKVRIVTDRSTRRIVVDWGDLKSDVINVRPGTSVNLADTFGMPNPLPEGTYELHHAYDEPENRVAFDRQVSILVTDRSGGIDQRSSTITLTPKYTMSVYRASVRLLGACDFRGQTSEFKISQKIDGEETGRWEWEPSNNFFSDSQYHVLPLSQFVRVWEVGTNVIRYAYDFRETDGFLNADDTGRVTASLGPTTVSDTVERDFGVSDGTPGSGCKIRIRYDREVKILNKLPSVGQIATFENAIA